LIQRGETVVEYNDAAEPKWKLAEDRKFKNDPQQPGQGRWTTVKLADDKQLNAAKLDELKTALDDLKIVDVARKPAGLSADLKAAADFTAQQDAAESLARKGFWVAELTKGHPELFSNDGEIRIVMKDGVVYVLRFGEIAGAGAAKKDDKAHKDPVKNTDKKKDGGLNRYLFVMAEFDPAVIPKPQLEPLPEAKKEAVKKESDKKSEKKSGAKKDDKKTDDAKALQSQREAIEKENKRKQEEYDQKVAEGKKRVAGLNARFADWYYVISDDVYHKIHLGHAELFQKKEKPKSDDAKGAKKDLHAGHDHGDK
jgi:hypothetical protein